MYHGLKVGWRLRYRVAELSHWEFVGGPWQFELCAFTLLASSVCYASPASWPSIRYGRKMIESLLVGQVYIAFNIGRRLKKSFCLVTSQPKRKHQKKNDHCQDRTDDGLRDYVDVM